MSSESYIQPERIFQSKVVNGIPEISVSEVYEIHPEALRKGARLIDVRRPEEFNNELGHIAGAELVTLGPELSHFLENGDRRMEIIFICRSGVRSESATTESLRLGYKRVANMVGGMLAWNEQKLPTQKV